jgi:hypothetical protein
MIIECDRQHYARRGTLAAVRGLACQGRGDLFEF